MQSYLKELRNILLFLIGIIVVSFAFTNEINLVSIATFLIIMCACVYLSSLIVIYKVDDNVINRLYKMLSISFAGVGMMPLSYIYVMNFGGNDLNRIYDELGRVFFLTMLYEPIACISTFKLYDKKIDIKKYIFFKVILVCGLINNALYTDNEYIKNSLNFGYSNLKLIINIVFIILYIYIFTLVKKIKKEMTINTYNYFIKYIICKIIMHLLISVLSFNYNLIILGEIILAVISANYFMLQIMFIEVIKSPREILFRELYDKSIDLENAIRDLKRAKGEVEIEAAKSSEILRKLPNGIVILEEGKIVYANDELVRLLNVENYNEIIGMAFNELIDKEYINSLDINIEKYVRQAVNGKIDIKVKYRDVNLYAEVSGIEITYYNGKRFLYMIRNISDRKELEKIENMLEEKKRNEEIKNELLTNISHEFKTPINVIYSAIQIQDLKKNSGDIEEILKYNKTIKQNCYRLIRLINNFIDTTRLEDGAVLANKKYINIVSLVEDISMSVLSFARNAGINIIFDTDEEEVLVNVDKQLIERVILNILSNSIKYSKKSGHIEVNIKVKEDNVDVVIKDNGIGIPEERQCLLFNRFERIDKSLSRSNEGTGLGLNLAKKIINLHGGEIRLKSRFNIGTEVMVTLPIVKNQNKILEDNREEIEKNSKSDYNVELEMSDIYL